MAIAGTSWYYGAVVLNRSRAVKHGIFADYSITIQVFCMAVGLVGGIGPELCITLSMSHV